MIRIDEIYTHTFWPWLNKNCVTTEMYYCDPFGHTDPEHLFKLGANGTTKTNYVFMHDQEPIWMDLHKPLFEEVILRSFFTVGNAKGNKNLNFADPKVQQQYADMDIRDPRDAFLRQHDISQVLDLNKDVFDMGHVIVSEKGQAVHELEQKYGWQSHYYFYHGWASLDWYRGYDKTFLIERSRDRTPTKTFISPNRIVGGRRDHRVLLLYHIFKNHLDHNHITAPRTCPHEHVDISQLAHKYYNTYNDIVQVIDQAPLPRLFSGETTQEMSSCWLTNFAETQDSLLYVVSETVYFGNRLHLTEKTFKPIALEMPFVLVAPAHSLAYLREYGFRTFADVFDESYDQEEDDIRRLERITKLLKDLDGLSQRERMHIHRACKSAVEHNWNHFFHGGFADVLWTEMNMMLNNLQKKLS